MSPDEYPPEDNLALAQRRAERVLEHGTTVVGISVQALIAGMSFMWLLTAVSSGRDHELRLWFSLVAVVGFVVTVTSWLVARRRRMLQSFAGADLEHPYGVLNTAQQQAISAQLRGRADVTPESAPLVRAMLLGQRRATRAMLPSMIGMALSLLAVGATSSSALGGAWPWILLVELGAVVSVTAMSIVQTRRRNRILAELTGIDLPEGSAARGLAGTN